MDGGMGGWDVCLHALPEAQMGLQNPRMIFSEKGRTAPFLRKNHPLNQQCPQIKISRGNGLWHVPTFVLIDPRY
jgi:hypothetical protein